MAARSFLGWRKMGVGRPAAWATKSYHPDHSITAHRGGSDTQPWFFFSGACSSGPGCDDAVGHVDHASLHQLVSAARSLHQGHRRVVWRVRHFRLRRPARIRSSQLRLKVGGCLTYTTCMFARTTYVPPSAENPQVFLLAHIQSYC